MPAVPTFPAPDGRPPVKIGLPVLAILLVVVLTIVAAVYRVGTAPERMRMRLNAAKATCINGGGQWVKSAKEEACRFGPGPSR